MVSFTACLLLSCLSKVVLSSLSSLVLSCVSVNSRMNVIESLSLIVVTSLIGIVIKLHQLIMSDLSL
jgi:hypothetical protein